MNLIQQRVYKDVTLFKYKQQVFYKSLWNEDPMIVESRGLIRDNETDDIVTYPFTKVFNLHENGTTVDDEVRVVCPRKVNGFMAAASLYKGEVLVSTTGTIDSDFAKLAREVLEPDLEYIKQTLTFKPNCTMMFEIVHPSDPHIVDEVPGAYLIGMRRNYIGSDLLPECYLDFIAMDTNLRRPEVWRGKFKDLPLDVRHEGYMVRDSETGKTLCKIKSKYYLFTKFWMRSKKAYTIADVDEEFYDLVNSIRATYTEAEWSDLDPQSRRKFIEDNI